MKHFLFIFIALSFSLFGNAELASVSVDSLRSADLLFVVNNKGNAITAVTEGLGQLPIDHVAIFYTDSNTHTPSVVQADYEGVRCGTLQSFCYHDIDTAACFVVVGRIDVPFDSIQSLKNALSHLGKPYDYYYLPDDKEIYCSELVQISYVTDEGKLIFSTIPMTFRNREGEIPEFWVKHYAKKGIAIPEGEPGTNPGELSRRKEIKIIGRLVVPKQR